MHPDSLFKRFKAGWTSHLGTVALVLVVFFGIQAWQTRHFVSTIDLDTPVQWLDLHGQAHEGTLAAALNSVRPPGQATGLYIWAEWCPICRAQQPTITRLALDWPVLTVAMQSGDAQQVLRYQRQHDLPWITVVDPQAVLSRAQGFNSVPAFVVLDGDNRLRYPTVGYTTGWGMRVRLWAARLI